MAALLVYNAGGILCTMMLSQDHIPIPKIRLLIANTGKGYFIYAGSLPEELRQQF